MERFAYPEQRSACQTLLTHAPAGMGSSFITRVRVSPGYSIYTPALHMVGVHVGAPVPVLHNHQADQAIHVFRPGDMFFVPAEQPLESAHPAPTDTVYIYLSPALVGMVGESIGVDTRQIELRASLGGHDPVVNWIGLAILQEITTPGLGGQLYTEALLMQLCVHLLRHCHSLMPRSPTPTAGATPSPRDLRSACDFIEAHLSESLTLSQIAAVEHLTPFHFSRLFKQIYGASPHQYIIRKRVEQAQALLKNPRLSVSEIAHMVGFADHSHLIRHFKRLTGTTPRAKQQEHPQTSARTS